MKEYLHNRIRHLALFLYESLGTILESNNSFAADKRIEKEISLLNPGKRPEILAKEYYVKKITYILITIVAGIILTILLAISEFGGGQINEDYSVTRNEYGTGSATYELLLNSDDYEYGEIDVVVGERIPSSEEMENLISEFVEKLKREILSDNDSLSHIETDVNLVTSLDGYPFFVRWEISDYELIDDRGNVANENTDPHGREVILRANISYKDYEEIVAIPICIYKRDLSFEESRQKEIEDALLISNSENSSENKMYLPIELNGHSLEWREKKEHKALVLLILMVILILGIWQGTDRDMHKKYEIRNQELLSDYAEIVSGLEMYLSAGLTIRGSIEKLNYNYQKRINRGGQRKACYEELGICIKKLKDGYSEAKCYEQWGNRCNLLPYKKLATLLCQNLRKGTNGLIVALENESRIAFEERKALVRRKGEEAQTKLLFPMILMLGLVMVIIMIPAYLSFGI